MHIKTSNDKKPYVTPPLMFQDVTAMAIQRSVTLTLHAIWPLVGLVVVCVMTAGTTVLDLSVSCVGRITTRTLSALWTTPTLVYVSEKLTRLAKNFFSVLIFSLLLSKIIILEQRLLKGFQIISILFCIMSSL